MENVIITGADGFVGSYTVNYFLDQGKRVLAIDMGKEPSRLKDHPNLRYIQCDISKTNTMLELIPIGDYDTFLHFAWVGSSGPSRDNYNLQIQNALNTVECLKAAKELGCSRFLCAGSIMEYEIETVTHAQGSRPGMGYMYAMGKHVAHCMCKIIASKIGIDLLWPIVTNAYGVGEVSPRFVNTTLRKIINKDPLHFTSATQYYDFVYVSDVAKAFYLVADKGIPFCEYMIGSGNARPLRDFIWEMVNVSGTEIPPHFGDVPFMGGAIPLSTYSIDDIKKDCGFTPEVSFSNGIKKTMDWLESIDINGC